MNEEVEYINKCLDFIESIKPSQQNPAVWLKLKVSFVPRARAFVNGEKPTAIDIANSMKWEK